MERNLHILSPNAPKALGSALMHDLYYIIQELAKKGIKSNLHIPFYEQLDPKTYESTQQLYRYKNDVETEVGEISFSFIDEALSNIQNISGPVLYYGNTESLLYFHKTINGQRKIFFRMLFQESLGAKDQVKFYPWGLKKIKQYLKVRKLDDALLQLKKTSITSLVNHEQKWGLNTSYAKIPAFTGMPFAFFHENKGSFCLFHGDLKEKENEYAAFWLLEHVFNKLEIPFVIAGNDPSDELEKAAHLRMHTCLVANPTDTELNELIKKAQLNLLPSFSSERKDMNLYRCMNLGKHILTNRKGLPKEYQADCLSISENPDEFINQIPELFDQPFTETVHLKRVGILNQLYKDQDSIEKLITLLF